MIPLPASLGPPPPHRLIFQPTLMYLFTSPWVVRLVLKQIPFPPVVADPSIEYTCLSDFRKRLKLPACLAVCGMKEVEKDRGWAGSFSE